MALERGLEVKIRDVETVEGSSFSPSKPRTLLLGWTSTPQIDII
jgi:hypothetical protein